MIDLEKKYLDIVLRILAEHVPQRKVLAFGSRVSGAAGKYSDLDLAIVAEGKLEMKEMQELKTAFAESDLPIMVDALDISDVTENFKAIILSNCETIQQPGK